jgi:ubiquinone/menaquinone biosynthesis C-methylase UbiE
MARRSERKRVCFWLALLGGLFMLGRRVARQPRQSGMGAADACGPLALRLSQLPHAALLQRMLLRRVAQLGHRLRVLDIGSGAGELVLALASSPHVAEVTGVDLSAPLVQVAQERAHAQGAKAEFLTADGADLPFPEGSFDLVVATLTLHHWENPEGVLREAKRVLAPGGTLLLVDLRRDAAAVVVGAFAAAGWVRRRLNGRSAGMADAFASSFVPWEAALLLVRAGFRAPKVETYPFTMLLTAEKVVRKG